MITGYFKNDLLITITNFNEDPFHSPPNKYYPDNFYIILFVIKGVIEIQHSNKTEKISENQMILIDIMKPFAYNFIKNNNAEIIKIMIHPTLITLGDDEHFLRIFSNQNFASRIISIKDELVYLKSTFESIKNCVNLKLGRTHLFPRVCTIISELCIYHDKEYASDNSSTDSIPVKIINYIERHYLEKITYQILMEKFFISKSALNIIIKKFTGTTLNKYLNKLRLKDAKLKLYGGMLDYNKVSQLCGYSNYSTFYRAYLREFGVSPNQEFKKYDKERYPYT